MNLSQAPREVKANDLSITYFTTMIEKVKDGGGCKKKRKRGGREKKRKKR